MGSPLAPVLANLFMGHHEKLWLEIFQDLDDTNSVYFIRKIKRYYFSTTGYINSGHPNIRFTMEKEVDHKIPFLHVLINNDAHFPVISVYRKKTWLGFQEDIMKLTNILHKNVFPVHLVQNVINRYLTFTRHDCNPPASVSDTTLTFSFELPYIGPFSVITQKIGSPLC